MQRRSKQYEVVFVDSTRKGSLTACCSFQAVTSGRYLCRSAAEPIHHFHPFSRPADTDVRLSAAIIKDAFAKRIAKTVPRTIIQLLLPGIRPSVPPPPSAPTSAEDEMLVYFAANYNARQPNILSQMQVAVMADLMALGANRFLGCFPAMTDRLRTLDCSKLMTTEKETLDGTCLYI